MAQVGEKALSEVNKLAEDHMKILNALDVDNVANAVKRLSKMEADRDEYRKQVNELCEVLEVDNWHNAKLKAKKLIGKQD
jgi:hypothetical protein